MLGHGSISFERSDSYLLVSQIDLAGVAAERRGNEIFHVGEPSEASRKDVDRDRVAPQELGVIDVLNRVGQS